MNVRLRQEGRFTLPQALSKEVTRMVDLTVEDEAKALQTNIKKKMRRRFRKGEGDLARSVKRRKRRLGDWEVYSDSPYAEIKETGGTVRAHRSGRVYTRGKTVDGRVHTGVSEGKRLAIPVPRFRGQAKDKAIDELAVKLAGGAQHWGTFVRGDALMLRLGNNRPFPIASLPRSVRVKGVAIWIPEQKASAKRMGKALATRIRRFSPTTGRRLRARRR